MLGDVAERFLHDPIEAQPDVCRHALEIALRLERHGKTMCPRELAAVAGKRNGHADVLEQARMELVGEVADPLRERDSARLQSRDLLAQPGRRVGRQAASERAQGHRQGRQLLVRIVMEVTGDAAPLLLLRGHQPPGQIADLRVALLCGDDGALSLHGMGEDIGQKPEAPRQEIRPPAPLAGGADHETSEHGPAAAAERDHGDRPGAEVPERLAVDDGLIGQIGQPRQMDHVTLPEPRGEPGALDRPDHRRAGRHAIASPRLREPGLVAPLIQRPHRGPVDTEALPDQLESLPDGFLGLSGSARREPGREVGEERLEPQALGQALLGPAALGPMHEQSPDEPALEQQRGEAAQHDAPVLLPQRGRPEADDALRGQPAHVESPALDLPGIEYGDAGAHVRRLRPLSGQHLKG